MTSILEILQVKKTLLGSSSISRATSPAALEAIKAEIDSNLEIFDALVAELDKESKYTKYIDLAKEEIFLSFVSADIQNTQGGVFFQKGKGHSFFKDSLDKLFGKRDDETIRKDNREAFNKMTRWTHLNTPESYSDFVTRLYKQAETFSDSDKYNYDVIREKFIENLGSMEQNFLKFFGMLFQ